MKHTEKEGEKNINTLDEKMPVIQKSYNYGMFKFLKENRPVLESKVLRIKRSIEEDDQSPWRPIEVNRDFGIIDGQHQFKALELLKRPIYFVKNDNVKLQAIALLNAFQSSWSMANWAHFYAKQGFESYKICIDFSEKYKLTISLTIGVLATVFSDKHGIRDSFKDGSFTIPDIKKSISLMDRVLQLRPLRKIKEFNQNCFENRKKPAPHTMSQINIKVAIPKKGKQGFASMPKKRVKEIAVLGGKAVQKSGKAHTYTSKEAKIAGSLGGRPRKIYRKVKLIVFDLDGTLADDMHELRNLALDTLVNYTNANWEEMKRQYNLVTGIPFARMIDEYLLPDSPEKLRTLVKEKYEEKKRSLRLSCPPFPSTKSTLRDLSARGYVLAVSGSSKVEQIDEYLAQWNLHMYFNYILGTTPGFSKGEEHINFLKKGERIHAHEILFISDSYFDLKRAETCHIKFLPKEGLFFKKKFYNPIISHWKQLKKYL